MSDEIRTVQEVATLLKVAKALMSAHVPGWRELEERRCSRPLGGGGCGQ